MTEPSPGTSSSGSPSLGPGSPGPGSPRPGSPGPGSPGPGSPAQGSPAPPTALCIAGSDSGGGAGMQADLRTFFAAGVHGLAAVTAVTVQNSVGVAGFHEIPPAVVADQVRAVASDIGVGAAKTGMLASAEIITAVADVAGEVGIGHGRASPFVVDPVAASMHGDALLAEQALEAIRERLLPIADLVTPNLDEVRLLTGIEVSDAAGMREAARALAAYGPRWVLVKGGHLGGADCLDLLYDGSDFTELPGPRYPTRHTHGGGDTLAAVITARLAAGDAMAEAVATGKRFIERCVAAAYPLGAGTGPVSPFWRLAAK